MYRTELSTDGLYVGTETTSISGAAGAYSIVRPRAVAMGPTGRLHITGDYAGSNVDFDPGPGLDLATCDSGLYDRNRIVDGPTTSAADGRM